MREWCKGELIDTLRRCVVFFLLADYLNHKEGGSDAENKEAVLLQHVGQRRPFGRFRRFGFRDKTSETNKKVSEVCL